MQSQERSFASLYTMPEPPTIRQSILLGWISSLIGRAYSKQQAQGLPIWLFLLTPVLILRPMCVFSDALSWSTVCDPMDCSLPGSSVHGILQARMLEWVAISSSRGSSWPKDWTCISCFAGGFFYHWVTWEALWDLYLAAYLRPILGTIFSPLKPWDSCFIWESLTCVPQIMVNSSRSFKGVGIILIRFLRKKSKPNDKYIFDDGNRKPRSLNFFFTLLTNMHRWCLNLHFHATSSKPGSLESTGKNTCIITEF